MNTDPGARASSIATDSSTAPSDGLPPEADRSTDQVDPIVPVPSLAGNSLARLGSDVVQLLAGLAAATVTARILGPADKGTLSILLLVSVLASYASSMGLGDASVILRGRKAYGLREAAESMALPVLVCTMAGVAMIWIAASIASWGPIADAVLVASLGLPLAVGAYVLNALHNGEERLMLTSVTAALGASVSFLGYLVFLVALEMGILGGVLAAVAGSSVSFGVLLWALVKRGEFRRPRWNMPFLKSALRLGLVAESAFLLVALSQRLDALIVYGLLGEGDAGRYSISLTFSQLVWYGSFALAAAGFPRMARVSATEAEDLTARVARTSIAASILSAAVLIPVTPLVINTFLGAGFRGAVVPAIILVLGGIIWSEQWVLARASAARGGVQLYLASFASSVAAMALLDLLLIRRFGIVGAAWASVIGSCVGLGVCLSHYGRTYGLAYLKSLVPSTRDVFDLIRTVRSFRDGQPSIGHS